MFSTALMVLAYFYTYITLEHNGYRFPHDCALRGFLFGTAILLTISFITALICLQCNSL